ncbi:MAG: putative molybdenum carrier protein [Pirellulales bacterium]
MDAFEIISGGQTGADRAALDVAIALGLPHGGWCPCGRMAEDGPIDGRYNLQETPSTNYAQRTEWNVRDSDATVVFSARRNVAGGTALTLAIARRLGKPVLHLVQGDPPEAIARTLWSFLREYDVRKLNIAGPRASQEPQIGEFVTAVLTALIEEWPQKGTKIHKRRRSPQINADGRR